MLRLDAKNQLILFARVRQNMLMNEHIIEQQLHIWRLIIQNPAFFYPFREKVVTHILREMKHLGIRSQDAFSNRELSLDMMGLIISFGIRDTREREEGAPTPRLLPEFELDSQDAKAQMTEEALFLLVHTQVMNTICRVILISCVNPAEVHLCYRGLKLMEMLIPFQPRVPLCLEDVDHFSHYFDQLLTNYPESSPRESVPRN